jgi:hypothetical protein
MGLFRACVGRARRQQTLPETPRPRDDAEREAPPHPDLDDDFLPPLPKEPAPRWNVPFVARPVYRVMSGYPPPPAGEPPLEASVKHQQEQAARRTALEEERARALARARAPEISARPQFKAQVLVPSSVSRNTAAAPRNSEGRAADEDAAYKEFLRDIDGLL